MIANQRKKTFKEQFILIFKRTSVYIYRNPRTFYVLIIFSIFMALIESSIYGDVGELAFEPYNFVKIKQNYRTMSSWAGLTFFDSMT